MKHIHKPIVALAISLTAMFIAVPMASARTVHYIQRRTQPAVGELNMHSGPSQNDSLTGVAGSNQYLCAVAWATGETIYYVANGQLQANNTWYNLYSMNYWGAPTPGGYPSGWSSADYVNPPDWNGFICSLAYSSYLQ